MASITFVREELIQGILESAEECAILVSSHDLSEIETFASHLGYMEQGRLVFSEEVSSLTERFREVEVTLGEPSEVPHHSLWPSNGSGPKYRPRSCASSIPASIPNAPAPKCAICSPESATSRPGRCRWARFF